MPAVRGKTAIVTGGANGIGFQYCRNLLINGAKRIAILDLPNSNGEASANKLNSEFGDDRALFVPSDVTEHAELEVAFKTAVESLGRLDILINNAGILNDAIWEKAIAINFTGLVKSTLLGYEHMAKNKGEKGGIIVNISSIVGLVRVGILPVYTATKHAVLAFTVSLKDHFKTTGVSVRVLCPGVTDTPLITDADNKYLDIVDQTKAATVMLAAPRQPTTNVGEAMIEVIEKGANGSVWVSQAGDEPFELKLAEYDSIK